MVLFYCPQTNFYLMQQKNYFRCYFRCENIGFLHRFPNHKYNENKFILWRDVLDPEYQKKDGNYIYNNLRLCDFHFEKCYRLPNGKLTRNAVPSANLAFRQVPNQPLLMDHSILSQPVTSNPVSSSNISAIVETIQPLLRSQGPVQQVQFEIPDLPQDAPVGVYANFTPLIVSSTSKATSQSTAETVDTAMENIKHCRFCAEPKNSHKMVDLVNDKMKCEVVVKKLNFLNAIYVNVSSDNNLPRTVCFVCYETLNKAYEFLDKVKKAQTILCRIYNLETEKCESSDEDMTVFDEILSTEGAEVMPELIKQESTSIDKDLHVNKDVDVKKEPKDEMDTSQDSQTYNQTLNVQDILDATMCNVSYPEVTIYAKEVNERKKKTISLWKEYPWICSHCDIEFLDIITLRLHSKITHGKCSAFVCIDCNNVGNDDFDHFIKHVKFHRKKLRKRCHYCDENVNEDMLPFHIMQHFQKNQVSCSKCGEILKNNESLQKHLGEFNSTKPKRKPRRKRGTPLTIEDLTCGMCKKVYKNPNSLRDHMKIHTNDRKRNYTCDRCGKMFYNKGTLTSHVMAHDEVRPHICRICNKSFLFPNMLRRHVEMHSGVKPFSCEQCGRCFRLQYQLNAHKIIHTDSMPHICQYCSKAFRFKQILKNHERQHTGAKPYSCQNCGMEFTNWSNYNKHMKRRHGLDTSKKKITTDGVFPINPQTGELVQFSDASTEEWKKTIMIPGKRGKKKIIKIEEAI